MDQMPASVATSAAARSAPGAADASLTIPKSAAAGKAPAPVASSDLKSRWIARFGEWPRYAETLLSLDPANRAWMMGKTYRDALQPGEVMSGNLYDSGTPLPTTLEASIAAFRADSAIQEILDPDVCNDLCVISEREWQAFVSAVTQWDYDRYLRIV